ncbi:MAG: polysaccharide deacetylase family protein [Ginsengibacter sp.]
MSFQSGLTVSLINRAQKAGKLIITYHNVLPASELTGFFTNNVDVSETTFEFQIKSLLEKFIIQPAKNITAPDKKGIFLSFDDGMFNNIQIIEPVLKKYGLTAMFGICSGLVQSDIAFIWRDQIFLMLKNLLGKKLIVSGVPSLSGREINENNLNKTAAELTEYIQASNKMDRVYQFMNEVLSMNDLNLNRDAFSALRYSPMDIMDIKYLKNNDHFIASHTHTHRKLSMLSDGEIEKELRISRDYFTKELGGCNILVYPYGSTNEVSYKVRDLAAEAGYKYAFLNMVKGFGKEDLFIPRINMGNVSTRPQFFGILAGINKLFK